MGLENMRRWPMYTVFAVCILLLLSLFNSWSMENELRNEINEISTQLKECSKQQSSCLEETLSLLEQKEGYVVKVNNFESEKLKFNQELRNYKVKSEKFESQVNHTLVEVRNCKTELETFKNLEVSQKATLDALRLQKDQLTSDIESKENRIHLLEKEIEDLKASLNAKSVSSPSIAVSKVTPAAQLPKLSPVLMPGADNDAKEEIDDSNPDGNLNEVEFDPNMQ